MPRAPCWLIAFAKNGLNVRNSSFRIFVSLEQVIDVCKSARRNLQIFRARFSSLTRPDIGRAIQRLDNPDKR